MVSIEQVFRTQEEERFNVGEYLVQRNTDPNFVLVEIGHDSLPVAYMQPFEFRGRRAYIGVEAWLRDPAGIKHQVLQATRDQHENGQNAFYIAHDLGGTVVRRYLGDSESRYEGDYEPTTLLPDGAASEVLISNVFGDHHTSNNAEHTRKLLVEAGRLIDAKGCIVIRETITPLNIGFLTEELIRSSGLVAHGLATPADETWPKLESVYKAEPAKYVENQYSFYMFLSKK